MKYKSDGESESDEGSVGSFVTSSILWTPYSMSLGVLNSPVLSQTI